MNYYSHVSSKINIFLLSQNYSAEKLLVILGVEWQNIFLCSCNQLDF